VGHGGSTTLQRRHGVLGERLTVVEVPSGTASAAKPSRLAMRYAAGGSLAVAGSIELLAG
jgi:hypothetical protein